MSRSLNKVMLIGNLTRDPEVRYTGRGTPVASFSIATNREWNGEDGEKKEDVEFHRIVAWSKLGEICGQYLKKGSKVYVEGRLQTRNWQTKEGEDRTTVEVVINEMVMLDSKGSPSSYDGPQDDQEEYDIPDDFDSEDDEEQTKKSAKSDDKKDSKKSDNTENDQDEDDDIPF